MAEGPHPQKNVSCIFPFVFKGTKYNGCIFTPDDDNPWCSTKVNEHGHHITGLKNWGTCQESCPIIGLKTNIILSTSLNS